MIGSQAVMGTPRQSGCPRSPRGSPSPMELEPISSPPRCELKSRVRLDIALPSGTRAPQVSLRIADSTTRDGETRRRSGSQCAASMANHLGRQNLGSIQTMCPFQSEHLGFAPLPATPAPVRHGRCNSPYSGTGGVRAAVVGGQLICHKWAEMSREVGGGAAHTRALLPGESAVPPRSSMSPCSKVKPCLPATT
jgi:hypothetical protein